MARKLVQFSRNSGVATDCAGFEKFTIYAAASSVVSLSYDGTTYVTGPTVPAAGYITITDVAKTVKVNAAYQICGLNASEH